MSRARKSRTGRAAGAMLALLLSCAHAPPSGTQGAFTSEDVLPDLWKFWDAHRTDLPAEQAGGFRSAVAGAHPELLGPDVFGAPIGTRALQGLLVEMPRLEPKLRALSERLAAEVQRTGTRFAERFPGFGWRGPVALSLSFGQFETVWRTVKGRRTLVIGEDAIAFYRGPYTNLAPLLDHALAQALIPDWSEPGPEPLWSVLWHRGFPFAVARALNPAASDRELGLSTPGSAGDSAYLSALARRTRGALDSTREADRKALLKPVWPEAGTTAGDLLGARVAEGVARGHSLEEAARMSGPPLRRAIEDALKALEPPGS